MNHLEDGTLGYPVLAGILVLGQDGRRSPLMGLKRQTLHQYDSSGITESRQHALQHVFVRAIHVWNAPGKGYSCHECVVVIKSSALLSSNVSCFIMCFGLYSSIVENETVWLTQWIAFHQSHCNGWTNVKVSDLDYRQVMCLRVEYCFKYHG
jgi:hypothetical protein